MLRLGPESGLPAATVSGFGAEEEEEEEEEEEAAGATVVGLSSLSNDRNSGNSHENGSLSRDENSGNSPRSDERNSGNSHENGDDSGENSMNGVATDPGPSGDDDDDDDEPSHSPPASLSPSACHPSSEIASSRESHDSDESALDLLRGVAGGDGGSCAG